MVSSTATEWVVGNNQYNEDNRVGFVLLGLPQLKRIVIGGQCFGKVRSVELSGLFGLESVVIGVSSFSINTNDPCNSQRSDGLYRIVNSPKLKSIQIGYASFSDYHSFELNNLPSLQSIDIGQYCFYWAPSFSLTGLID